MPWDWEVNKEHSVTVNLGDIITLILLVLIFIKVWGL